MEQTFECEKHAVTDLVIRNVKPILMPKITVVTNQVPKYILYTWNYVCTLGSPLF